MALRISLEEVIVYLLTFTVSFLLYKLWEHRRAPPGPWGVPILGYLLWIDKKHPHYTLTDLAKTYGPIYSLSMGSMFTVVLSDSRLIKEALALPAISGRADLSLTHGIMEGYGIIASEGTRWKEQRKFITSTLKSIGMVKVGPKKELMESKILKGVDSAVELFRREGEGVDPEHILLHALGNVVNDIVFGVTWPYKDPDWVFFQEAANEGAKLVGVAGPINFLPFLRWVPKYRKVVKFIKEGQKKTHEKYMEIVADRLKHGLDNKDDILSAYLREILANKGQFFDYKQLVYVLADMYGAGVDTTLTTLRWFLLYCAANPHVQVKIQEEVDEFLKVSGRTEVKLQDVPFLPFMEATIYETLRIKPVVPLGFPRGVKEDTELAGYRIPKGAMVIPLQYSVHNDPQNFDSPELFDPERFFGEKGKVARHDHLIPFQSGKRACPGEELAKMMLFLFGGNLLRHFEVTPASDLTEALQGEVGITLTPGDHKLNFKRRNFN